MGDGNVTLLEHSETVDLQQLPRDLLGLHSVLHIRRSVLINVLSFLPTLISILLDGLRVFYVLLSSMNGI